MSAKFEYWITLMNQRDELLVMLAGVAIASVLSWVMIEYIVPQTWRQYAKNVDLALIAVLYLTTIAVGVLS